MAKFEVDIDDKGEFVGPVPDELDAILKKIEATAQTVWFGKGSQKAAEEAKKQIEDGIKAERKRWEAEEPLKAARFEAIDHDNKTLREQLQAVSTDHSKTLKAREDAHAADITRRAQALEARNGRIKALVNQNLRAIAAQSGAREESLSALETVLQSRIGYNDDMEPYVKTEDGAAELKTAAGNPIPLDVFVKQFLDVNSYFRKPVPGRGGESRGGASLRGGGGTSTSLDAARQRVESGDRSIDAINDLFLANRKPASA